MFPRITKQIVFEIESDCWRNYPPPKELSWKPLISNQIFIKFSFSVRLNFCHPPFGNRSQSFVTEFMSPWRLLVRMGVLVLIKFVLLHVILRIFHRCLFDPHWFENIWDNGIMWWSFNWKIVGWLKSKFSYEDRERPMLSESALTLWKLYFSSN